MRHEQDFSVIPTAYEKFVECATDTCLTTGLPTGLLPQLLLRSIESELRLSFDTPGRRLLWLTTFTNLVPLFTKHVAARRSASEFS
ncbi:hypothetical protein Y032_0755g2077 [Ancylostoma ceylanicum]|uniref:Uncharacterized protein n=1 Tax=Ancylostoma ceylanicum TaxID=53326 RepID=A0A016WDN9_9BILA|nr:hypothetical protein Y032_0755g2077 [Ancylostoma ceylanicum]